MGDVDKKKLSFWQRTDLFLSTVIGVGLFFLPGGLRYKSDDVSVTVKN